MIDFDQVWKAVYDKTQNAIRIKLGSANVVTTVKPSGFQAVKLVYDATNKAIKILNVGVPGQSGTKMDFAQVLKSVYDLPTGKLRGVI